MDAEHAAKLALERPGAFIEELRQLAQEPWPDIRFPRHLYVDLTIDGPKLCLVTAFMIEDQNTTIERLRMTIFEAAQFIIARDKEGMKFPMDSRPIRNLLRAGVEIEGEKEEDESASRDS